MNNNGERICQYNDTLIKYLNDLVKSIDPNNQIMIELMEGVCFNLKKQLTDKGLDIAENGVKTLLTNTFNEYIKILKYYFDHSDIKRIDINDSNSVDINSKVNQITNNLASAVNNINKLPEYNNLINRVKATLVNYCLQTFADVENVESISEQIINDCIISCINNLAISKINEFNTNTLPTLIAICDDIHYVREVTQEDIEAIKLQANDERDAFIYDTMNVEIKEGFENGVVTLEVTDAMGQTTLYSGREAMDKLLSYNQLFEASRPGKKADISKWEHLLTEMAEVEDEVNNKEDINVQTTQNTIENNTSNIDIIFDNTSNLIVDMSNNSLNEITDESIETQPNELDSLLKLVSGEDEKSSDTLNNNLQTTNQNEQIIQNFPSNYDNTNNTINMPNNNVDNQNNFSSQQFTFLPKEEDNLLINNNLAGDAYNSMINATQAIDEKEESDIDKEIQEIKNATGISTSINTKDKEIYNNAFSFVPNFDNPNQERNDFIKKTTGSTIEEDVDNQGCLYLKVLEPIGREQIYTGQEAVNMIMNYNRTFLEANPGKKVDTSLIDKYKENN